MKKLIYIISLLLLQATAASLLAQDKPKAGDLIQGVVTDSVSPLMAVYITELDSADRAVAYAYTDLKGEFSFRLVNPKDRIQFSYYRKEKIVLPIDKAYFEIRMEDDKDLPPIYYAWGELEPKESYTWENYRLGVGGELPFERKLSKYNTDRNRGVVDNKTTLDLVDDVANVRWGGSWRIPTLEEWTELRQNCTWTVDSINGVKDLL